MVRNAPGRGLFRARSGGVRGAVLAAVAGATAQLLGGCEAASTQLVGPVTGPDSSPPAVQLLPAHDTTVDSTGTLLITVAVHDQSWIRSVQGVIVGSGFSWPVEQPDTTDVLTAFAVPLAQFRHSTFRFFVRAVDVLGHAGVSDTLAVSVR